MSDICDGEEYKKYSSEGGILSAANPANVSLIMNTEGVAIFRSSRVSLWPVWLALNELPPTLHVRFSKGNMLLAGFWFARSKPVMCT